MLAWLQAALRDMKIKNFTRDWNDGVALRCVLCRRILSFKWSKTRFRVKFVNQSINQRKKPNSLRVWLLLTVAFWNIASRDSFQTGAPWIAATAWRIAVAPWKLPNGNLASSSYPQYYVNCILVINLIRIFSIVYDLLGIPMLISPEDLSSPDLDELSGMTYLSYFMNSPTSPGYKATLRWVRGQIPDENVENFTVLKKPILLGLCLRTTSTSDLVIVLRHLVVWLILVFAHGDYWLIDSLVHWLITCILYVLTDCLIGWL